MRTRKPAWWVLYAFVGLVIVVLFGDQLRPIVGLSSEAVELVVVPAMFIGMLVWLYWNRAALLDQPVDSKQKSAWSYTVYTPDGHATHVTASTRAQSPGSFDGDPDPRHVTTYLN